MAFYGAGVEYALHTLLNLMLAPSWTAPSTRDLAEFQRQPTVPYAQPRNVTCLDLGRSGAVLTEGWDRVVLKTGAEAKAVKRRINTEVIYPPVGLPGAVLLALSSLDPVLQQRAMAVAPT